MTQSKFFLPGFAALLVGAIIMSVIVARTCVIPVSSSLGQTLTFEAVVPQSASAIPPVLKRTLEQDVVLRVSPMDAVRVRNVLDGKRLVKLKVTIQ